MAAVTQWVNGHIQPHRAVIDRCCGQPSRFAWRKLGKCCRLCSLGWYFSPEELAPCRRFCGCARPPKVVNKPFVQRAIGQWLIFWAIVILVPGMFGAYEAIYKDYVPASLGNGVLNRLVRALLLCTTIVAMGFIFRLLQVIITKLQPKVRWLQRMCCCQACCCECLKLMAR